MEMSRLPDECGTVTAHVQLHYDARKNMLQCISMGDLNRTVYISATSTAWTLYFIVK